MLGSHKVQSQFDPVVNMTGIPATLNSLHHWIIYSGANEHMVGDSALELLQLHLGL